MAPRDPSFISFPEAQAVVNAIWSEMDLLYPPKVEPLASQATTTVASADRLSIFLPERTPSWCLLHEIAHSMTTNLEGQSDGHGSLFMGVYVRLLARYLRLDLTELVRSLWTEKIQIEPDARPVFLSA